MPQTKQYTVQAPNGQTITIEGPAGASEQEVISQAQRLMAERTAQTARTANPGTTPAPTLDQKAYNYAKLGATALGPQYGTALDTAVGAVKGAGSTAQTILSHIPGVRSIMPEQKPAFLNPTNTPQKAGYVAEQIGEFFVPGGSVTRGAKAVEGTLAMSRIPPALQKIMGIGARAGLEATSAGTVTAAQGGSQDDVMKNMALSGGIPLVLGVALKGGKPIADKIEMSLIRPTQADVNAGFKIETLGKYNLMGPLGETARKTHEKIAQLSQSLRAVLGSNKVDVDILQALQDAATELKKNPDRTMGFNSKIDAAVDFWLEELQKATPTGKAGLLSANDIKRSVGKFGAWLQGARDPEAGALEMVSNAFYSKLRGSIEAAAPNAGIRAINQQIGELIPVEQAVIRRLPIADRQNVLSLSDVVTLTGSLNNPNVLWLTALNKLSKSGRFAQGVNAGAQRSGGISSGAARAVAAANTARRNIPQQ